MTARPLSYSFTQQDAQWFASRFKDRELDLQPHFQRRSVWTTRDREKFLSTVLEGWPVPAVFLHRDDSDDRMVYSVIDGKQRLESVLIYMGVMKGDSFAARLKAREAGTTWAALKKDKEANRVRLYRFNVIEVSGDLEGVFELFVRINSTGKPLSRQECRNALLNSSEVLKAAARLAKSFTAYLRKVGTISPAQAQRMKTEEFMCELILAAHERKVLDKKKVLDPLMKPDRIDRHEVADAAKRVGFAIKYVKRSFPRLRETRFGKISDFYSLIFLIMQLRRDGFILDNKFRARQAWRVLASLAKGVDAAAEGEKGRAIPAICHDYLMSVKEGTDAKSKREQRHRILAELLASIYARKDSKRLFTQAQRRLIWHSSNHDCGICGKVIESWDDFAADHVKPHSHGGSTALANAKPVHRACNSRKGNRTARRRKSAR